MKNTDTIVAVATGGGGALAVIRLSGPQAIALCDSLFRGVSGKKLADAPGYTLHYGTIERGGEMLDDVLVSVFRAPHSHTGEEAVEIGCHASPYIEGTMLRWLIDAGARAAAPGEFTLRAFRNGKLDLSQAEAVADLIAADSRAAHRLAMDQMRGGYSGEFRALRERLIDLAALLELELDFSEEDVQFADRQQIESLMETLAGRIAALRDSYAWGNVLKNGIPVAIVGAPNVGKSTLLNALLREDRAMVSDIPGTTRDSIEDTLIINGLQFRFIDTAGLRATDDRLEAMGIERTRAHMERASVILFVADASTPAAGIASQLKSIDRGPHQHIVLILNKIDRNEAWGSLVSALESESGLPVVGLSAKSGKNLEKLTGYLLSTVGRIPRGEDALIVTSARHYEALSEAHGAIGRALAALSEGFSSDLLSEEVRGVIHWLGTITGDAPTPDDVLGAIFSRFCIGK